MSKSREHSDALRAEAKEFLNRLLGIPAGTSSETVERLVDCIIRAALLKVSATTGEVNRRIEHEDKLTNNQIAWRNIMTPIAEKAKKPEITAIWIDEVSVLEKDTEC